MHKGTFFATSQHVLCCTVKEKSPFKTYWDLKEIETSRPRLLNIFVYQNSRKKCNFHGLKDIFFHFVLLHYKKGVQGQIEKKALYPKRPWKATLPFVHIYDTQKLFLTRRELSTWTPLICAGLQSSLDKLQFPGWLLQE